MTGFLRFSGFALLAVFGASGASALELHQEKSSPFDLALKGRLEGVPAGETRYLRHAELAALPTRVLKLTGEFVPGEQEVTVVMLDDVLAKLPRAADADVLIATCTDGYVSVFTNAFIAEFKPFVVIKIDGKGPETWPPQGLDFNPGPYVISISKELAPGVAQLLDESHKRPWGVETIEVVNYAERFAVWYTGALKNASPLIAEGRDIWINSCMSCHESPQHNLGGTKGARPIQIVATYAAYNMPYFRTYVRDPKKLNPNATMSPYPHYSDEQLKALIAFLKATMAK